MSAPLVISIRSFQSTDYERIAEISNLNFPQHQETAEEIRSSDEKRDAKFLFARFVAEDETGEVIAYGGYSQGPWQFHPSKFSVGITVHPDFHRRGVGTQLYSHICAELEQYEPIRLSGQGQEGKTAALAFLAKNGFEEVMRDWESCLKPADFDFAPYTTLTGKMITQGIVIKTLRELESDPCRNRKLYDLEAAVSLDMPSSEAATVPTFADWKKHTFETPGLLPDGYFIAIDTTANDAYVGLSQLWASQADKQLYTGATGVLPEYRRRGIALALKLRAVQYAKETEAPLVRTWNAQSNRAMLSINEKLGFEKEPAWIEFHCKLRPEPIKIRQATPRDYEAIATVWNAVWPEYPETAAELQHSDRSQGEKIRHDRFVVEDDGRVVGIALYTQRLSSYDPQRFQLEIAVLPEYQGRGFGKALYEHVCCALRPFAPHTLTTYALANRERGIRFLEDRGFVVTQREQISKVDPSGFDASLYTSELEKVTAQGITLKSFAELKETDPDALTKYEELHWQITQDIPQSEEPTRASMNDFMKRFDNPRFLFEGNFIAVEEETGKYVATTQLWGSGANSDLHTGMTGVRREYRKRGIATALKIRALAYAKERGSEAVWTANEVGNVGMLGINFRFGFEKQPEEMEYTKKLRTNAS